MASGADAFSSRGAALWSALSADELSLTSSNSSISSASSISSNPQRGLSDFSPLLNTGSTMVSTHTPAGHTFLDDLLRDDNDAAFFSLPAAASSSSSSASTSSPVASSTSRLLQLESNYERKKKRAKINRKDLNSRFQELMDMLHLKEDRKLNRAKILEKAIEQIEKLTAEVKALKGGQSASQRQLEQVKTKVALHRPHQLHAMPAPTLGNSAGTSSLLPFDPSQWSGAAGASLPLAPMMWVPCSMVTSSGLMLQRTAPDRPVDSTSRKRGRVGTGDDTLRTKHVAIVAAPGVKSVPSSSVSTSMTPPIPSCTEVSLFVWSAQEIPSFLAYCDAWTLAMVMQTSRDLGRATQKDKLWSDLSRARWRIPESIHIPRPLQQWKEWHSANRMPECTDVTPGGLHFASGQGCGIGVWGLLSHRSNGHTTRTVLVKGKATVMQVVELYVVVQNLTHGRVRMTDCISVTSRTLTSNASDAASSFEPFVADSGAHLTPQVVAFNNESCTSKDVASIVLHHGDLCVLSVFLRCSGLALEDQFLRRAGWLKIHCELDVNGKVLERVTVRAACQYHSDDRTRKKSLLQVEGDAVKSAAGHEGGQNGHGDEHYTGETDETSIRGALGSTGSG